jgi:bis(5'-nucleosyl)-tetraphosphatase (symmetrical)
MAVYAIGDVQGCQDELLSLLDCLQFDESRDQLWFVGDLVNRGPRSLDTLRFVKSLGDDAVTVLGNHDLHLLALARGGAGWREGDAGLRPILAAPDADELLDWLQSRPLLHHDASLGVTLLHAGLPPQWTLQTARACAAEVQRKLRSERAGQLYNHMYGNDPDTWRDDLDGWDRIRFSINAFTRLRVCETQTGRMALKFKGPPATAPASTQPWFRIPWRKSAGERLVFGHWSAMGYVNEDHVLGLDTGCVWGGSLTGQRIDTPDARPVHVASHAGGLPLDD